MSVDHIRYDILAQEALRGVVRTVLTNTARKGLHGDHHFFISFDTRAEGVRISPRLREQYPEEMTIILQHQFWDLKVGDDGFEVGLSFAGVPERLSVPFAAIKSFVDPSVQFALQFEAIAEPHVQAGAPTKTKGDNETGKETVKPRRPAKNASIRTVPSIPAVPALAPVPGPGAAGAVAKSAANPKTAQTSAPPDDKPTKPKRGGTGGEVVRLDRFRKK
jgi:hypothetical protein